MLPGAAPCWWGPHVQGLQERLICAGAFEIVLMLFRLLFCLSCTRGRAAGLQLVLVLALIPLGPHYTAHGVDTDLYTQKAPQ